MIKKKRKGSVMENMIVMLLNMILLCAFLVREKLLRSPRHTAGSDLISKISLMEAIQQERRIFIAPSRLTVKERRFYKYVCKKGFR